MKKRIVITGVGCLSPLGNDVSSSWQAAVAGVSGAGRITHYDPSDYKTQIACEVKGFDGAALYGTREARRMDRYSQLGLAAAQEAVKDANLTITDANRLRIGAIVGTGIGGAHTLYEQIKTLVEKGPDRVSPFMVPMMLADTVGGMIAIHMQIQGPNFAVVTACATGTN
ncbi:MAG: hypothetical protein KIT07_11735, partial [Anaerolineales bacterium]|nr:hypothetical protein [Anaerolineales bacterium]